MFDYNKNKILRNFDITLPQILRFDMNFLSDIADMLGRLNQVDLSYCVRLSCPEHPQYDKLCMAYIYNIALQLNRKRKILWNIDLNNYITSNVSRKNGKKFSEIDIEQILGNGICCYNFKNDQGVAEAVDEIVKFIMNRNLTLQEDDVKEFLTTIIGEIFSNATNHSNQDELFLMYCLEKVENNYYLSINVVDYGKTIISNVKEYQLKNEKGDIEDKECMRWAIIEGNTTRNGSGGYGLSTLIDYANNVDGKLAILSGNVFYEMKNNIDNIQLVKGNFPGTSVSLKVKLFELEKIITYDKEKGKLISVSLENL